MTLRLRCCLQLWNPCPHYCHGGAAAQKPQSVLHLPGFFCCISSLEKTANKTRAGRPPTSLAEPWQATEPILSRDLSTPAQCERRQKAGDKHEKTGLCVFSHAWGFSFRDGSWLGHCFDSFSLFIFFLLFFNFHFHFTATTAIF